ncbi:MAG: phosphoesterase [Legionella sp.]|nr:MAG: phosphoesterase [Legionella sp.]PJE00092.1 MAG: phosphoesterase [Legionella sp.]
MSRGAWNLIKSKKNFNVGIYRRGLSALILSLILSTIMALLIIKAYFDLPKRAYYATSGVTPPVELTALDARNMTSTPLLTPDVPSDDEIKVIPE